MGAWSKIEKDEGMEQNTKRGGMEQNRKRREHGAKYQKTRAWSKISKDGGMEQNTKSRGHEAKYLLTHATFYGMMSDKYYSLEGEI